MKKITVSGAVWPEVRKVLGKVVVRCVFALVSMVVVVYAMSAYKRSTGWNTDPMQEVKNLFSLLAGFGVIIGLAVAVLVVIIALGMVGVKSVRKGGTGSLVFGLAALFAALAVTWFGGTYVLDQLMIERYRATWYLPAFFGLITAVTALSSWLKQRRIGSGRSATSSQRSSNMSTESVPTV